MFSNLFKGYRFIRNLNLGFRFGRVGMEGRMRLVLFGRRFRLMEYVGRVRGK